MTTFSFNIFIFYLSFILHPSHGFEVIQPRNRTVNSDGWASISCEHTADSQSVVDVRLNSVLKGKRAMLCQKGKTDCKNIIMHQEDPYKYIFVLLIGPEPMKYEYECEVTVDEKGLDITRRGKPTILLPGAKEASEPQPSQPPPPPASSAPPPPPPQSHELRWILCGLLALMSLYSCVITSLYIRLRSSDRGPENSTYVVMRKAPLPRNPGFDIYCG